METFDFTTLKLSTYLYDLYVKIIFNRTIIDSFYLSNVIEIMPYFYHIRHIRTFKFLIESLM
jgi:hypothetical protein